MKISTGAGTLAGHQGNYSAACAGPRGERRRRFSWLPPFMCSSSCKEDILEPLDLILVGVQH